MDRRTAPAAENTRQRGRFPAGGLLRSRGGGQAELFSLPGGGAPGRVKLKDLKRTIFDNVPEVAWVKDAEGRFVAASPMFAEACGVPQRRLIGRTDWDIWPGELAARHATHERKVVASGNPSRSVFRSSGKDGGGRWTEIVRTPIVGGDGNVMGTLGIARDISPYKQAASRLCRMSRQVLRAREEEKKRISNLLHDEIGSLIMRLGTAVFLMGEEAGPACPGALARIKEAKAMVKELAVSVRNICFEIRPPAFGVNGLGGAVCEIARRFTVSTGTRIRCEVRVPDEKRIDDLVKIIVYRIVQEALNNAVKYSGAAEVRVSVRSSGGRLAFSVSDDGKGFDPEAAAAAGGSTLGLKIMREESESVGGEISVSSGAGFGTVVRGDFPFKPCAEGGGYGD